MERSKIVAIITGAISVILALAYLLLVQLLDFRGEMIPAPQSQLPPLHLKTDGSALAVGMPDYPSSQFSVYSHSRFQRG